MLLTQKVQRGCFLLQEENNSCCSCKIKVFFSHLTGITHDLPSVVCLTFEKGTWLTSCSEGTGEHIAWCWEDREDTKAMLIYLDKNIVFWFGRVGGLGSRQVQHPVEVMQTLWACVVWLTS